MNCYRGVTYVQKGEYDKVIENFNKVLSINPNDGIARKIYRLFMN